MVSPSAASAAAVPTTTHTSPIALGTAFELSLKEFMSLPDTAYSQNCCWLSNEKWWLPALPAAAGPLKLPALHPNAVFLKCFPQHPRGPVNTGSESGAAARLSGLFTPFVPLGCLSSGDERRLLRRLKSISHV